MTENPLGPSVTYMQYYNAGGLQIPTAKRQEIDRVGANDSVISTTTNKLLDVNSSSESYIKTLMLSCGREPRFLDVHRALRLVCSVHNRRAGAWERRLTNRHTTLARLTLSRHKM